jgi:sterol desaturase/sphingolipid hydroxylase (fatty acid hydroxylase superfamily)
LFSLVGFLFGLLIARVGYQVYAELAGLPSQLTPSATVAIVLVAVGIALLTLWLRKYVLILATSFMGATFLCAGVALLHDWLPLSFLVLFLSSLVWQTAIARVAHRRRKRE